MVLTKEEEMRKGLWTEQEDLQLVHYVGLCGQRRWDFISKVSGLNRTGKSCRLRWVNYLHPNLKSGRLTPQEERLVLELHSRWGNKWSRIARRLPGRTDNEIKNYWRTHTRRRAQEQKRSSSSSSSSSSSASSSSSSDSNHLSEPAKSCIGAESVITSKIEQEMEDDLKGYSMDEIWDEIDISESGSGLSYDEWKDETSNALYCSPVASPIWDDYSLDALWKMDDEQGLVSVLPPICNFMVPRYQHSR